MSTNENVHKMRAQILNLRSAELACATAVHRFPPCGRLGGDHRQCPEARAAMQRIYEDMKDLMVSSKMALDAVFDENPDMWDFIWEVNEAEDCIEHELGKTGSLLYYGWDEYSQFCAEMDSDVIDRLGTSFSDEEWKIITGKEAWQNGIRLPQVLHLLKYLEDRIAKQFISFDSVLCSGLLGDCSLGRWAAKKKSVFA
jgi:hypothetical protein